MIEGPSGLRALAYEHGAPPPVYDVSRRRLSFDNGAEAFAFSSQDPDSLRGPQFDTAWCDEIAAWSYPEASWDMLQFALRIGRAPRAMVTTTPRPIGIVRRLVAERDSIVTRARTSDNAHNLAEGFLQAIEQAYAGTRLGRQELDGELLEAEEGCLWTRSLLGRALAPSLPDAFDEVVVAVDPPAGASPTSDACGIVAAGRASVPGFATRCFILADASAQGLSPLDWSARVVSLARRVGAQSVVAEANQGGEMVRHTLHSAGCELPVRLVQARVSKRDRAMPVSTLYARGQVAHAAGLSALEDEMCAFGTQGEAGSPDRVDALVWAVWALMLDAPAAPRVRSV
jgi:phage terminase large subunit-like protein